MEPWFFCYWTWVQNFKGDSLLFFWWKRPWHIFCLTCLQIVVAIFEGKRTIILNTMWCGLMGTRMTILEQDLFYSAYIWSVFSNGYMGQFLNVWFWYIITRQHNSTICNEFSNGCQMTWNYFVTDHGKGKVDGVGALLEQKLKKIK